MKTSLLHALKFNRFLLSFAFLAFLVQMAAAMEWSWAKIPALRSNYIPTKLKNAKPSPSSLPDGNSSPTPILYAI